MTIDWTAVILALIAAMVGFFTALPATILAIIAAIKAAKAEVVAVHAAEVAKQIEAKRISDLETKSKKTTKDAK